MSREIFNAYFEKLVFIKVDKKEDYTIYAASINSSFGDGKKEYVLLFVPVHMSIADRALIQDLHWKSLQTRILANGYKLKPQKWEIPRGLQSPMFNIIDRSQTRSKYVLEGFNDMEMILQHDPKKNSKMQYHNKLNIIAALSTFKCIIVIEDQNIGMQEVPQGDHQNSQFESETPDYLPRQIVCDNKYCYYQSSDGTLSAPIQGYKQMGISYNMNSNEDVNHDGTDSSFQLL